MTRARNDGLRRGTVVLQPFQTTVPWNELSETAERFWSKSMYRHSFQFDGGGTLSPSREGALASLSGRSVPLPFPEGTTGTLERCRGPSSLPTASIRCPDGATLIYRRHTKLVLGPMA